MKNLITLTVNSTHFYLIDCNGGKLLVDAGWELPKFTSRLKAYQVPITQIRYVMFTHHHPDHAGLVQAVKELSGARMIIHQVQIPFLPYLQAYYENKGGYVPIRIEKDDLVSPDRAALKSIGIEGVLLETPGHSQDSISLVLDSHDAFIGDLTLPDFASPDNYEQICESWKKLIAHHARLFYHSHSEPFPVTRVQSQLPE
jgi:ribonuclease/clavin/mitogillin